MMVEFSTFSSSINGRGALCKNSSDVAITISITFNIVAYLNDNRKLIKIGIVFSSETRTISEWKEA